MTVPRRSTSDADGDATRPRQEAPEGAGAAREAVSAVSTPRRPQGSVAAPVTEAERLREEQLARNGRWGSCGDCPLDASGAPLPEQCRYTDRYDHHLAAPQDVRAENARLREWQRRMVEALGYVSWGDCYRRDEFLRKWGSPLHGAGSAAYQKAMAEAGTPCGECAPCRLDELLREAKR